MKVVKLIIPGRPVTGKSGKIITITPKGGRPFHKLKKPDGVENYQAYVSTLARSQSDGEMFQGAVAMDMNAVFNRSKSMPKTKPVAHTVKPDTDNIMHRIVDALEHILFAGDQQINLACITKRYRPDPFGAAEVQLLFWDSVPDPPTYSELAHAFRLAVEDNPECLWYPEIADVKERLGI